MDAMALSPEESRELAALRRRAYGPQPDIDDDPAALARLEALESALHAHSEATGATEAEATTAPGRPEEEVPDLTPHGFLRSAHSSPAWSPPEDDPEGEGPALPHRRTPRRWLVVAGAVALVCALVWGVTQLSAPRADATLSRIPAGEEGQRFARQGFLSAADVVVQEVQRFEPYEALQMWLILAESGDRCLVIEAERYGILGVNCTPAGLEPTLDLRIWRGMRTNVFGHLPPGTFLRFVHSGDRIHVWVRPPPPEEG
jgi:hypothetical protein